MFGELNDRGLLAFNGRERHGIRKLLNIFKPFQALIPGLVRMDGWREGGGSSLNSMPSPFNGEESIYISLAFR